MTIKDNNTRPLYTSSGCLTAVALEKLARGTLIGEELIQAEAHIASCELCADSLDGVKRWLESNPGKTTGTQSATGNFANRVAAINERVQQQLLEQKKDEPVEKILRIPGKYRWVAIAASLLIFAGIYFLVRVTPAIKQPSLAMERQTGADSLGRQSKLKIGSNDKNEEPASQENKKDQAKIIRSTIKFTAPVIKSEEEVEEVKFNQDSKDLADLDSTRNNEVLEYKAPVPAESQKAIENSKNTIIMEQDELSKSNISVDADARELDYKDKSSTKGIVNKDAEEEIYEKPFTVVEQMPEFTGGESKMMQFLHENIKYPQLARESGIAGSVYVTFVIGKNGAISDVKLLRGIGGGCDEEALRIIRLMPRWVPGKQNGKFVPVQFNLPIKFTLQ